MKIEELEQFKYNLPKTELSGRLSISSVSGECIRILSEVTTHFCKKYPGVNVKIIEQNQSGIVHDVENGKCDLGYITGSDEDIIISGKSELIFEKLFDDNLLVVVGKKHLLAAKKSISMKQAIKEPLVLFEPGDFINNVLYAYGNPNIYLISNSDEVIKKVILEGIAIGICMESNQTPGKEEVVFIPIREKPKVVAGILRSNNYPFSPVAQEFVGMLKAYF